MNGIDVLQLAVILAAAACLVVPAARRPEWRGGLLSLAFVFLAAAANECEPLLAWVRVPGLDEPELVPIALALAASAFCAWRWRGSTLLAFRAIFRNRRFPLLVWGLLAVSVLANLAKDRDLWNLFVDAEQGTHDVREAVCGAVRFAGYVLLLNWSVLFLRDKFRRPPLRQSPLAPLVFANELVEVGRGTRRVAYRVGDTGYCVKFYYPQEQCIEALKMQKSIQRDVKWRRFNKYRNASSQEVYVYDRYRHTMPDYVRARMPAACGRVFHPVWGWGVIETYYTNPDGTAILPYEDEIKRQTPAMRALIYAQAVEMLDCIIAAGAHFYEPGNFHVLIRPDGIPELKLIDFEPESKTAFPVEALSRTLRRRKLARKAKRYLAHLRRRYGIAGKTLLWLAAERAFGVTFARFDRLSAGNSSRNFRAETDAGARYFIKFAPARVIDAVFSWHSALATPLVPAVAFGGRTGALDGHRCCAFEWCDGETSVDPERLTSAQIASLVEAYARLSAALQAVAEPPCRVACAEEVDAGMPMRVIHGDLHYKNVFFRGDTVMHFLDFEKMRRGYPTEDLLRFFLHALERTRFWRFRRMDALVGNFAETVRQSPYPAAAWLAAIDIHEKYKAARRRMKSRFGFAKACERLLRAPLYRRLRKAVRAAKGVPA